MFGRKKSVRDEELEEMRQFAEEEVQKVKEAESEETEIFVHMKDGRVFETKVKGQWCSGYSSCLGPAWSFPSRIIPSREVAERTASHFLAGSVALVKDRAVRSEDIREIIIGETTKVEEDG